MQLEKIISIAGKPGLYKLISQVRNGFIIEDVITKKKLSINNSSQVSLLDNISIYTTNQEVPLFQVMENIAKSNNYQETLSHKSEDKDLRSFMQQSLPDYDEQRVYASDIKKLAQWYNILHKAGYITEASFVKPENEEEKSEISTDELTEKPTTKKLAKSEKTTVPKVKATAAAKSAPKSTHRKQG